MHAQENARPSYAESAKQQSGKQGGIKPGKCDSYGERGDGVAGRKGESIRRQKFGPAVRLDITRAFAARKIFEENKASDSRQGCRTGRRERQKTILAAKQKDKQS